MCIVIDASTLAKVFDNKNKEHRNFSPVRAWIFKRHGYAVFGGKKYKRELKENYLKFFIQLRDAGMAVPINDEKVDQAELLINQQTRGSDCDDQHIIALLGVSRCLLFCTSDKRAMPFIRNRSLFPKKMGRVKVYTQLSNKTLLTRSNPRELKSVEACPATS